MHWENLERLLSRDKYEVSTGFGEVEMRDEYCR